MNDDDVRALVREAIQRHLGAGSVGDGRAASVAGAPASVRLPTELVPLSFSRYKIQRVSDDGMCLIEPAVRCNHCGYCECHGH